jgi:hypothetical protein
VQSLGENGMQQDALAQEMQAKVANALQVLPCAPSGCARLLSPLSHTAALQQRSMCALQQMMR